MENKNTETETEDIDKKIWVAVGIIGGAFVTGFVMGRGTYYIKYHVIKAMFNMRSKTFDDSMISAIK